MLISSAKIFTLERGGAPQKKKRYEDHVNTSTFPEMTLFQTFKESLESETAIIQLIINLYWERLLTR